MCLGSEFIIYFKRFDRSSHIGVVRIEKITLTLSAHHWIFLKF